MVNGIIIALKAFCLAFVIYLSIESIVAYNQLKKDKAKQEIMDEELINRVKFYSSVNKTQLLTKGASKEEYEQIQNELLRMIDEAEYGQNEDR